MTRFPDKQRLLELESDLSTGLHGDHIMIQSGMDGFGSIELIWMAKKAIEHTGFRGRVSLFLDYLIGARCDRAFSEDGIRYLAEILAPAINSMRFDAVYALDPHSDVSENVIERFQKIPFEEIFEWHLRPEAVNTKLIAPDAGASKKIDAIAKRVGITDVLVCSKTRDLATGKITKTVVPRFEPFSGTFLICDDIVDGGRTFLEIANELDGKAEMNGELHLRDTHGIFSNPSQFKEMCRKFRSIKTTDSVRRFTVEEHRVAREEGCSLEQVSTWQIINDYTQKHHHTHV